MNKHFNTIFSFKTLAILVVIFFIYLGAKTLTDQKITTSYGSVNLISTIQAKTLGLNTVQSTPTDQPTDVSQQNDFEIIIPKIGVDKKVIPNVDPTNQAVYGPVLENYVAHGEYTKLPDEAITSGNVYLFAHREGYINGHNVGFFSRLNELTNGDIVYLKFMGKTYTYTYWNQFIITPEDTWVYTGSSPIPTLTLQTCENGSSERLIVKLKLVNVQ